MNFYQMPFQKVEKILQTNINKGLSQEHAILRLKKFGPNTLPKKKPPLAIIILIKQFINPLMFILLIAGGASILLKEFNDAIVITIAALVNVIVGFIQEYKAEKAVTALLAYEATFCNVRRNGKIFSLNAKELVPGDIILLSAGNKIPADIRLTHVIDFTVEEAILTGESKPVKKKAEQIEKTVVIANQTNIAFSGTYALSGKAEGIVIATGKNSQLGKIAQLVTQTKEELTPLQNKIKNLSWILGAIMLAIITLVAFLGIIKGISLHENLIIGIALAVAAIPEGLLIAITATLAIGMQRMLKRNALVRHLIAAETLGSVSVICTDKTGTLTGGHMSVVQITTKTENFDFIKQIHSSKKIPQDLKNVFIKTILNNDAQLPDGGKTITGNPTEIAILKTAQKLKIDIQNIRNKYKRIAEIPFSSDIKYMATINSIEGTNKLIVKGAPEKVFDFCKQDDNLGKFKKAASQMAKSGLRILAVAEKTVGAEEIKESLNNLDCIGLIGIKDPLRPESYQTINELKNAGIRVILITGDHKDTAINIAKEAGIEVKEKGFLTGKQLDEITNEELQEKIEDINVFARVEPKHKIRIINALKKTKNSVAMIGDGVNDAPALKAANIGVALGSGSDVAHEVSDMVLLDNNLSTIDAAVKEGRTIFDNIRKIIVYLMSDSFSEIILIGAAILFNLPLPISAIQIFWINLVTDGLPDLALTLEPSEKEVMQEKPRPKNESILNTEMKVLIFIIGIITDIGLFVFFIILLKMNFDLIHIRTIIFTALAIDSLFYVFSVKSFRRSIFKINLFSNKWLCLAVLGGLLIQISALFLPPLQKLFNVVPLKLFDWVIILTMGVVKLIAIEITKEWFIVKQKKF